MSGARVSSSKNNYQFSDSEHAFITLSGNQTTGIANTNPVKFDTPQSGSNITFDPATYRVTLKKNRTYAMRANCYAYYAADGSCDFYWYNVTAGAEIGKRALSLPQTATLKYNTTSALACTITPTVDTVVEIRIGSPTQLTGIYATYSWWEVQQINIVSPVIPDPTRQNAYESPMFDIAVTSAGAGFVNTRTTGLFYKTSDGKWRFRGNSKITLTSAGSIALTFTGVTFLSAQGGGLLPGTGTSGSWLTTAASTTLNMYFTSNSTYGCISFDVELASKPTGYAIPSDV